MSNDYFQFQQFRIDQKRSGMKVTTDACLFGAWVADLIRNSEEPKHILDIGSGTGLLSLMIAQVTKNTQIYAVEMSEMAFAEAKSNFAKSPWSDRLKIHHGPAQDYPLDKKYDLIICNPPFFNKSQKGRQAARNLALHSEHLPIEDLVHTAKNLLTDKGELYTLYPEQEMNAFTLKASQSGLHTHTYVYVKNERNQPIFRVMRGFTMHKQEVQASEIIIRKEQGEYTPEFWQLLKDYYLEYNAPNMQ